MKLPKQKSDISYSMTGAMRNPVLRKASVQHQASTQRFIGMPTDYNQVANAKVRAANAKGKVGLAFADVAIEIDYNNQKADYVSKTAELKSWIAGYNAEQTMRQDLSEQGGADGSYNYENMQEDFQRELKAFEKELDQKYKFTNQEMQSKYGAFRSGQLDYSAENLSKLQMGAERSRIQGEGIMSFDQMAITEEGFNEWKDGYSAFFSDSEMAQYELKARDSYNGHAIDVQIKNSIGNSQLDSIEENVFKMHEEGEISLSKRNNLEARIRTQQAENVRNAKDLISNAHSPEQASTLAATFRDLNTITDTEANDWSAKRVSDLTIQGITSKITTTNGLIDSPVLLSEANTDLDEAYRSGVINDNEYAKEKKKIHNTLKGRAQEDLEGFLVTSTASSETLDLWHQSIVELGPEANGYSANDPNWIAFQSSLKTMVNDAESLRFAEDAELDEDRIKLGLASSLAYDGATIANGLDVGGHKSSEIKDDAYDIVNLSAQTESYKPNESGPENTVAVLEDFVKKQNYVPTRVAEDVYADWNSGEPARIQSAIIFAMELNKRAEGRIANNESSAFSDPKLWGAFEAAIEVGEALEGVNLETELGQETYARIMQNRVTSQVQPDPKRREAAIADFDAENIIEMHSEDFPLFSNYEDAVNKSEIEGFMQRIYVDAVESGKRPDTAARLALSAANQSFGMEPHGENQILVKNSITVSHNLAGTDYLEKSLEDFSSNPESVLTPEQIAQGFTIDESSFGKSASWMPTLDGDSWIKVDENDKPIITVIRDANGVVVEDAGGLMVVDKDSLSPEQKAIKQQDDLEKTAEVATTIVEQIEVETAKSDQDFKDNRRRRAQQQNDAEATARQSEDRSGQMIFDRLGERHVFTPEEEQPAPRAPSRFEAVLEKSINDASVRLGDPVAFEIANLQKEALRVMREQGATEEQIFFKMNEIRKKVHMREKALKAANPDHEPVQEEVEQDIWSEASA